MTLSVCKRLAVMPKRQLVVSTEPPEKKRALHYSVGSSSVGVLRPVILSPTLMGVNMKTPLVCNSLTLSPSPPSLSGEMLERARDKLKLLAWACQPTWLMCRINFHFPSPWNFWCFFGDCPDQYHTFNFTVAAITVWFHRCVLIIPRSWELLSLSLPLITFTLTSRLHTCEQLPPQINSYISAECHRASIFHLVRGMTI